MSSHPSVPFGILLPQPVNIFGPENLPSGFIQTDQAFPYALLSKYLSPAYRALYQLRSKPRTEVSFPSGRHTSDSISRMSLRRLP